MLAPKAFVQTIDENAYVRARLQAAAHTGALRFRVPVAVLSAALLIGAGLCVYQHMNSGGYLLTAIGEVAVAAILLLIWFWLLPQRERARASADFAVYDRLMNGGETAFSADEFTVTTPLLTREDSYANIRVCLETADSFLSVSDDGVLYIWQKSAFGDEAQTTVFLRDVFARKYRRCGRF